MAHIELPAGLPGIRGLLAFSPDTANPLCDLVEILLYGPNTLTQSEREMIATYVSVKNDCYYCQSCHGSTAAQHLGGSPADYQLIDQVKHGYEAALIPGENESSAQCCRQGATGREERKQARY